MPLRNFLRRWSAWILASAFILMAVLYLVLFGMALFLQSERWSHAAVLWILFGILFISIALPTMHLVSSIIAHFAAARQGKQVGSPLKFAVHVVPYGILSLSMLFEHDRVLYSTPAGMAALASIMVLFLLSQLGLVVYESSQRAESVAGKLNATLTGVNEKLDALPWLPHYLGLSASGEEDIKLVTNIGKLLESYTEIAKNRDSRSHGLTRSFLRSYIAEELRDLTATVDPNEIPLEVLPPLNRRGWSYFATNVGFYANFLTGAIEQIATHLTLDKGERTVRKDPCIAVITNALPSQFWLWIHENRKGQYYRDLGILTTDPDAKHSGEYYRPIAEYRKAQFVGARDRNLKVFRVILVGENPPNQPDGFRRSEMRALWAAAEWESQKSWAFIMKKPTNAEDAAEILTTAEVLPVDRKYMVPHLWWTPAGKEIPATNAKSQTSWMLKEKPSQQKNELFLVKTVWEHYCHQLHSASGKTEIIMVTENEFTSTPPHGFNACPDLMFLGTCASKVTDVWSESEEAVTWEVAILTTMNAQTQTMFMTLVYERPAVDELWGLFKRAKQTRGTSIAVSTPLGTPIGGG